MAHTLALHRSRNPQWLFERNYHLLSRLLPGLRARDAFVMCGDDGGSDVNITVLERHKYTTALQITKFFGASTGLLPDLVMTVRLYSDARVAEVIAYQECARLPCRFGAEGKPEFLPDEKRQANELLRELLEYCNTQRQLQNSGFTSV